MFALIFRREIESRFMATKLTTSCEWLSLQQLTEYAAVSDRTLRTWLHRGTDALPAVRVDGKILVRRSEFDSWLEHHRIQADGLNDVEAMVNSIIKDVQ
jgi:excisionase family DNA binding protein